MLSHALRAKVQNTTPPAPKDPNFNQVSLLLHGDGTNGAQNNTFLDSSTNNFTVTRNGNTTQGTNTPFSQDAGYWSNYNPTASSLTVATNAAFTYGVSDFTMECWVYLTTTGAIQYVIDQRNSGTANAIIPAIYVSAANVLTYFVSNAAQITGTTALTVGAWYHVAVSRSTLSTKMFLNGVQEGSTYTDANSYAASRVVIGSNAATAGNYLVGYVSNVRLVNGTGVYTTTFTPSTTPLTAITNTKLLTCQANYFKDNSSNNFTITRTGTPSVQPFSPFAPTAAYSTSVNGGSMYFDGNGDYLSAPSNAAFNFGTGDFTAECWCYLTSLAATTRLFAQGNGVAPSTVSVVMSVQSDGRTIAYVSNGSSYIEANSGGAGTITTNAWAHVAMVRDGNTARLYVNGVQKGTGSLTGVTIPSSTSPFVVGRSGDSAAEYTNGYISNMRVVKGTCVYPSGTTFTPSTTPLTAITNTSLLLSGTNAGIFDNAIKNDLETVGNAQVSTSVTKYGTGSMSFDGTGDYLSFPSTPDLNLSTGNFTVECWFYQNAFVGGSYLFGISGASSAFAQAAIATNGSGAFYFLCADNATNNWISASTGGSYTSNTWNHLAGVRNGNTFTLYLNGTSVLTYTSSATLVNTSTYNRNVIGAATSFGSQINGYIDDLRVTKGVARYTAAFTPPTAAFPNQ